MLAKDIMETNVISLKKETPIKEIAQLMIRHDISGFPVVNDHNDVLGVVSELDLMRKEIRPNEPNVWTVCVWGLNNNKKLLEYEDAVRKYMAETAVDIMTAPAVTVDDVPDVSYDEPLLRRYADGPRCRGTISAPSGSLRVIRAGSEAAP